MTAHSHLAVSDKVERVAALALGDNVLARLKGNLAEARSEAQSSQSRPGPRLRARLAAAVTHLVCHSNKLLQKVAVEPLKERHAGEERQEPLLLLLLGALGQVLERMPIDAPYLALDLG